MAVTHNFNIVANQILALSKTIEKNATDLVRKMGIGILKSVIYSTPHDEGHARSNWQVTLRTPENSEIEGNDYSGNATYAEGQKVAIAFKLNDGAIWICNNVPYINKLNNGWSKQGDAATPGYIERAISNVRFTEKNNPLIKV